jgi:hypothetical protein
MDVLHEALERSAAQLAALREGDLEGFLEGAEARESACLAAARAIDASASPEASALFHQVVAVNASLGAEIAAALTGLGARLGDLQRGRRATGAYLATSPRGNLGRREA